MSKYSIPELWGFLEREVSDLQNQVRARNPIDGPPNKLLQRADELAGVARDLKWCEGVPEPLPNVATRSVEQARSDAAVSPGTSPEIRQLERQLEARKRQAALEAKAGPGCLIETIETDRTGRKISKFSGDPEACWGAFKLPVRRVIGFNTK